MNLSSKVLSSVLNMILCLIHVHALTTCILLYRVMLQVYLLHIVSLTCIISLHPHISVSADGRIHPTAAQSRCTLITKSLCGVFICCSKHCTAQQLHSHRPKGNLIPMPGPHSSDSHGVLFMVVPCNV